MTRSDSTARQVGSSGSSRDGCSLSWALGVNARSGALLSTGPTADRLCREAIDRLERCRMRVDLARARLLYGEWLRRENRRVDARAHLHIAHNLFTLIGMEAFAERARSELVPTGETVRKRSVETRDNLTAQERQIAWLARDRLSNADIGMRLFLSPRTAVAPAQGLRQARDPFPPGAGEHAAQRGVQARFDLSSGVGDRLDPEPSA
jgi:ATP/maltotriose-dependent transcriptional regulator MalT